jgi:DALR anticodon binding domain
MQHWLQEVLNIQARKWQLESSSRPTTEAIYSLNTQIPLIREIPVKLDVNRTPVSYVSTIALLLEKPWKKSASEIAQKLVEELTQKTKTDSFEPQIASLQLVWKSVLFEANSSGWIVLKITDQGLSKWLESLIYFFQNLGESPNWVNDPSKNLQNSLRDPTDSTYYISNSTYAGYRARNSTDIFLAQHAHARCCSLLRLGEQAGLIQRAFPRGQGSQAVLPRGHASLQFHHSSEHQVIVQICQSLDGISQGIFSDPEKTLRRVSGLSQAFCRFYADCLIFNEVKLNNLALAEGRLALVDLVRSLLQLLLEDGLGIPAPQEL